MWLTAEGLRLALRGYAERIRAGQAPPVARGNAQFIEKGGRFYVCPICFGEREPLMQFAGDGATSFNC